MLLFAATTLAADVPHLSVDDALAALEAHNPTLARSRAQVDSAKGSSLVALSASLPTLSASGSYTRNNEEATLDLGPLFDTIGDVAEAMGNDRPEAPGELVLQPLESWSGAASVRVPLVVPSAWVSAGSATHGVKAANASLDATASTLRASAIQAFWSAGAAEAYVAAQETSVEHARRLVAIAEAAVAAGTSTRLSALEAQTDLARREGDLLQARANLEKARIAIGLVLGSEGPVAVDLPTELPSARPTTSANARGELRAAREQVLATRAQLLSVRLGTLPTLSGTVSAFASSEPYMTGENEGWKATVDLTWPILQGGLRAGNEARARAAYVDATAALEGLELQVAAQVRTAEADLAVARARTQVTTRQRALAEEAARVAQRSFEEGVADARTVLDALDRLDLARAAEIDARSRVGIADAALRAAVGEW